MRIAFVNSAWPQSWGGGEKWTVEAAAWFKEHGHTVTVIGRPNSRLVTVARERGLDCEETPFGGDFDPVAIWRAGRLLKAHRAEIVVVNFNKEAWQFGLAARTLGIPVVARHGYTVLAGKFYHRLLKRFLLSKLVVNAASIRDHYAILGFDVRDVDVIHNGTRIVRQEPEGLRQRFGIKPGIQLILAAGRLESQKRFDRLIEVAERLFPARPRLQVLIAGEGPLREELEGTIRARNVGQNIRLIGFVPDLAAICGDADLFLLTSEEEGTPNVLLEAMAAGVASVAFAVGSVPEILTGELKSCSIETGNTELMTNRVSVLLDDATLRGSVARWMGERVAQEFSLDVSMQRFETVFTNLLRK